MTSTTISPDVDEAVLTAQQERADAQTALDQIEAGAGTNTDPAVHHRAADAVRLAAAKVKNAFAARDQRDARGRAEQYRQLGDDAQAFHATQAAEVQVAYDAAVRALTDLYAAVDARNKTLAGLLQRNADAGQLATAHGEYLADHGVARTTLPRTMVLVVDTGHGQVEYRTVTPAALTALALRQVLQDERDRNDGRPDWGTEYENVVASHPAADEFGIPRVNR